LKMPKPRFVSGPGFLIMVARSPRTHIIQAGPPMPLSFIQKIAGARAGGPPTLGGALLPFGDQPSSVGESSHWNPGASQLEVLAVADLVRRRSRGVCRGRRPPLRKPPAGPSSLEARYWPPSHAGSRSARRDTPLWHLEPALRESRRGTSAPSHSHQPRRVSAPMKRSPSWSLLTGLAAASRLSA